jgi:uncharacterized protein YkwD
VPPPFHRSSHRIAALNVFSQMSIVARAFRPHLLVTAALAAGCSGPPIATSVSSSASGSVSTPAASTAADYRRLEREIVDELNAARSNPRVYASNVSALLPYFSGKLLKRPGWPVPVQTAEGASAVREAVSAVQSQRAVPVMTASGALALAAMDLVNDESRTGNVGHSGSNGSTPDSRVSAHGTWGVSSSENVDYGQFRSGRDVVVDLIVDDGVSDRGHRRNIFDPSARVVGVACGRHPRYGSMCVIDQVGSYTR